MLRVYPSFIRSHHVPAPRSLSPLADALAALSPRPPSRPAIVLVLRLAVIALMERDSLIHPARASATARERYTRHHALLAADRGWLPISKTFRGLDRGDARLGLRPLDSWLFSPAAIRGLTRPPAAALARCLEAVRAWAGNRPAAPDVFALGAAYETMLAHGAARATGTRKRSGSFYTPRVLVNHVLDAALTPVLTSRTSLPSVVDPSCGAGNFLVAAAERLATKATRAVAASRVFGIDIDPVAAELAAFSLWRFVGSPGTPWTPHRKRIVVRDALTGPHRRAHDVVVGNPPYLNQLQSTTVHSRARAAMLARWSDDAVTGYADLSTAFLLLASESCRAGGRYALVMPQSLLAARDASGVRKRVLQDARLRSLWVAGRSHFAGATVLTCVPCLEQGAADDAPVVLHDAASFQASTTSPHPPADGSTWSVLAARVRGVPELGEWRSRGVIGDLARATADFRDQYYGLEGFIVEDRDLSPGKRASCPPLITSGLIDCLRCEWGKTPTRVHKRVWNAPRVDRELMNARGTLGPWITARLVPKILLATQTPALEPVADPEGSLLPSTPVLTITPIAPADLWRLAAVLASPVATALAFERTSGSALSSSAVKLAAKQVLDLPLPHHLPEWSRAADHIQQAHLAASLPAHAEHLTLAAAAMNHAYALTADRAEALLAWWRSRALRGRA